MLLLLGPVTEIDMGQSKRQATFPNLMRPTEELEKELNSLLRSADVREAVAAVMLVGELQQRKISENKPAGEPEEGGC